ncbi:restriction endonuclease subunit S [Desulfobulbus sp.]|uniref:restriction endonuclease subunit S n=1 Tax=Desulfobulbus sp. TaxID=895 RepID=UPI00286F8048|nr:restriction endonuclease subunit S [Desulfobulbus sp.]
MKHPAYPKYKDSGVRWLGAVPEHWEVKRIKHIGLIRYGLGEPPEHDTQGLPFIRATDINRGKIDLSAVKMVNPDTVPWSRRPSLEIDEILIVRSGAYTGDSAIVTENIAGCIAGYDMVLTVTDAIPRFVAWVMLSKYMLEGQIHIARLRAAQPHLNAEELCGFLILSPPLPEQTAIADFLDRETGRIDTLVAKKRRLIALLGEKRAALISRTVTRGLPADAAREFGLEPHTRFKDSDIEWLGEVPEGWEVKRGRFVVHVNPPAPLLRNLEEEDEVSFIPMDAVKEYGGIRLDQTRVKAEVGGGYTEFQDGDVVIAKITPCFENGKGSIATGLVNSAAYGTTELHVLRASVALNYRFLFYLTITDGFRKLGESEMYGAGGQKRVPPEFCKDFLTPLPPLPEQTAIAAYLDRETAKIDQLVAKVEAAIARLQEYRTALITAAVTGKIDVRESMTSKEGA